MNPYHYASKLYFQPFFDIDLPAQVTEIPALLNIHERRLLYYVAKEIFKGWGSFVDAGCFVGGSTVAICEGLSENKNLKDKSGYLHTYDRFVVDGSMKKSQRIIDAMYGDATDDGFYRAFQKHTQKHKDLITLHRGDLMSEQWDGSPIEVHFLDVAKTWDLTKWIMKHHYSCFKPGTILIHQDYYDPRSYWLPLTVGFLSDYFELIENVESSTAVFLCTETPPQEILEQDIRETLSLAEALDATMSMGSNISSVRRGILEIQAAYICAWYGDLEQGQARLETTKQKYDGLGRMRTEIPRAEAVFAHRGSLLKQTT